MVALRAGEARAVAEEQLRDKQAQLLAQGAEVQMELLTGDPDQALVELAERSPQRRHRTLRRHQRQEQQRWTGAGGVSAPRDSTYAGLLRRTFALDVFPHGDVAG
jgi:hypothetical protein